jgi:antitoxin component of MazEF toxin-antitoxin module
MFTSSLRRSGSSLIMTVPQAYVEQNMLQAGSLVALEIAGEELRLKPARKRKTLSELLAATPDGLHRIDGWDEIPQAGVEL